MFEFLCGGKIICRRSIPVLETPTLNNNGLSWWRREESGRYSRVVFQPNAGRSCHWELPEHKTLGIRF